MITATTEAVEATRDVGAAIAELAHPTDVVLLTGDLGAGKTAFAQGFARGLGIDDNVTSPTFTLARSYEGRLRMHHLDVYRLEHLQEAVDLGLPEIVDDGGVTLIEWGDDERTIALVVVGPRWSARARALGEALAPWAPAGGGGC